MSRHIPSLRGWTESREARKYKTTYMSLDSQNEFIKILADECKTLIDEEINSALFTGVIADTTPDVSNDDQFTVAIRYVNKEGTPCERLLETKKVVDKSGAGLAKVILKAIQERKINTDTIRFQTYDSASAMSGKYKGAQQVSSELLERPIIYTACLPHGSNLQDGVPDQRQLKLSGPVTKKFVPAYRVFVSMKSLIKKVKPKHMGFSRRSKPSISFLQSCS